MTELFFAGIKTVCSTFGWAFLYFIENPDIQDRCRKDILDQVCLSLVPIKTLPSTQIGPHRLVTWNDRANLPYLEATVCEIQRCANIAPFSVFHRSTRDTYLGKYFIPRNTTVLMNLWTTLRDPELFPGKYHSSILHISHIRFEIRKNSIRIIFWTRMASVERIMTVSIHMASAVAFVWARVWRDMNYLSSSVHYCSAIAFRNSTTVSIRSNSDSS